MWALLTLLCWNRCSCPGPIIIFPFLPRFTTATIVRPLRPSRARTRRRPCEETGDVSSNKTCLGLLRFEDIDSVDIISLPWTLLAAVRRRLEELKRLEEERQEGDPPFSAGGFQIEHLEGD